MQPARSLKTTFVLYLLGLIIGGLYVGMISPVRLVIQEFFGLDDTAGIWMVNIYTLFYAACIPAVGKLADISGRKPVFLGCLAVFMVGSLICLARHWWWQPFCCCCLRSRGSMRAIWHHRWRQAR